MGSIVGYLVEGSLATVWGGFKHPVFSGLLNVSGLAQKVIGQSAPSFKAVLCYGLGSRLVRYGIYVVSQEAQKASGVKKYSVLYMLNALTIALEILARYGVAYLFSSKAGLPISMRYVHITAVLAGAWAVAWDISAYTKEVDCYVNPEKGKDRPMSIRYFVDIVKNFNERVDAGD